MVGERAGPEPPIPPISTTDLVDKLERMLRRELVAEVARLEGSIAALDRLYVEKFAASEAARREQKSDINTRTDAALAAVGKQIDSLQNTFDTVVAGLTTNLNDLKDRVTKAEGSTGGQAQAKTNLYAALSAVVALIAIVGFLIALAGRGG